MRLSTSGDDSLITSDEEEEMVAVRFICKNCGERFTAQVFEKGEAEEKRLTTSPVQCPRCRSTAAVQE